MAPRRTPLSGWNVLIAGIVSLGLVATAPARAAEADPSQAFFVQHCQACHTGSKAKGKFRLESLTQDFGDRANRERWQAALEQVQSDTMPPEEKPRPQDAEITALGDFINGRIAAAEAARGAAVGRVVLRRLNRAEYENTVRDLLGVDVDLKDLLPVDTSTSGFDNSAEALHVSSYLMDGYLEAADRVLNA